VTNVGTNGYVLTDAGSKGSCMSASDCDGGAICCLTTFSPTPTSSCQASCSSASLGVDVQFCATDTECGTSTCVEQVCASFVVRACGAISACTAAGIATDAAGVRDASTAADVFQPSDASLGLGD
jgi:hypothetical protein